MKYDTLNKKEFIDLCLNKDVYPDDMFDEVKRLTDDFDKVRLMSFFEELKECFNNLTFELIEEKIRPLDNKTYNSRRIVKLDQYLREYIWVLKEKNKPETSINSIFEIINTTNIIEKNNCMKILIPEMWQTVTGKYWNLIKLYNIAIEKYNDVIENTSIETNIFKTNLSDAKRVERCNEIITDKGGIIEKGIDNRLFVEAKEKDRSTIMYLLGGKYPDKVEPMRIVSGAKISALFKEITDVDGEGKDKGTKVIPQFMKRFCIEYLRNSKGEKIKAIK